MNTIKLTHDVVVNRCFGGYGLSMAAAERLAALKGGTAKNISDNSYPYPVLVDANGVETDIQDIRRNDPDLVAVVRELGNAANGPSADLRLETVTVEIDFPSHDGRESVSVSGWC